MILVATVLVAVLLAQSTGTRADDKPAEWRFTG
jgi:hypothetical protein